MLTLEFIIAALGGLIIPGETPITSAIIDSRQAGPGALFVALPGDKTDGHQFVGDALGKGAVAAIIERAVDGTYPVLDLTPGPSPTGRGESVSPLQPPICIRVDNALLALQEIARQWHRRWASQPGRRTIGLTGSVGKSTVKEMAADVLSVRYKTHRNSGSLNNEIGLPLTILHLAADHERAVLEMGFYVPGEIALLAGIAPPQIGLVTNISPVHLERAKTLHTIIRGKAELVEALPPDGTAILNLDDADVMTMRQWTRARVFTYGLDPAADVWADNVEGLGLDGVRFLLHHGGDAQSVRISALGRHSVYPALGAAAVGLIEGLTLAEIVRGLETSASPIRLKALAGPNGSILLDDTYNASPISMIAALNLLADLRETRHVAVLGDMLELGEYEEEGHAKVGRRAAEVADLLVTVGARARIIAREAIHGGMTLDQVKAFDGYRDAVEFLGDMLQSGDAVLVKGSRAVHMERIVQALREGEYNQPKG
jgi:UDP-N-acetylmuramoyl-tripeptide--D-alanyl-D-alanine ligase